MSKLIKVINVTGIVKLKTQGMKNQLDYEGSKQRRDFFQHIKKGDLKIKPERLVI